MEFKQEKCGELNGIDCGKPTCCELENGHRQFVDLPCFTHSNDDFPWLCTVNVYQRVSTPIAWSPTKCGNSLKNPWFLLGSV